MTAKTFNAMTAAQATKHAKLTLGADHYCVARRGRRYLLRHVPGTLYVETVGGGTTWLAAFGSTDAVPALEAPRATRRMRRPFRRGDAVLVAYGQHRGEFGRVVRVYTDAIAGRCADVRLDGACGFTISALTYDLRHA